MGRLCVFISVCVCVCERGKDKHTYLLHGQWHTNAVLFQQHGAVTESSVCALGSVYPSGLGGIVDCCWTTVTSFLTLDFLSRFSDVSNPLSWAPSSLSVSVCWSPGPVWFLFLNTSTGPDFLTAVPPSLFLLLLLPFLPPSAAPLSVQFLFSLLTPASVCFLSPQ